MSHCKLSGLLINVTLDGWRRALAHNAAGDNCKTAKPSTETAVQSTTLQHAGRTDRPVRINPVSARASFANSSLSPSPTMSAILARRALPLAIRSSSRHAFQTRFSSTAPKVLSDFSMENKVRSTSIFAAIFPCVEGFFCLIVTESIWRSLRLT